MAITYQSMTQAEQDELIAQEIHSLEVQHFQYNQQAIRQAQIIADLPVGDWPAQITYLKGMGRDQIIKTAKTKADNDLAQQYALRDHLSVNQASAELERGRVEGYHGKALAQIPPARLPTALAAARTKRQKEENQRLGIPNV